MKKLIASILLIPFVAFAEESPFIVPDSPNTANEALIQGLLGNANKNNAIGQAVEQRSFIERQNYIDTGNIYGDTSDAPVQFKFGDSIIKGDPLGSAQRKYEVQKYEASKYRYGR